MSLKLGGCGVTQHSGDSMGQSWALLLGLMGLCECQVHLWDHLRREGHLREDLAAQRLT